MNVTFSSVLLVSVWTEFYHKQMIQERKTNYIVKKNAHKMKMDKTSFYSFGRELETNRVGIIENSFMLVQNHGHTLVIYCFELFLSNVSEEGNSSTVKTKSKL